MTGLEALIELYNTTPYNQGQLKLCEIIENHLKRLESIDNAKPSEALRQYETMYDLALAYCEEHNPEIIRSVLETRNDNIKQALIKAQEQEKVLEIIKRRHIDILSLEECIEREKMGNVASALEYYNDNYAFNRSCELIQEEFDTLKRWVE